MLSGIIRIVILRSNSYSAQVILFLFTGFTICGVNISAAPQAIPADMCRGSLNQHCNVSDSFAPVTGFIEVRIKRYRYSTIYINRSFSSVAVSPESAIIINRFDISSEGRFLSRVGRILSGI